MLKFAFKRAAQTIFVLFGVSIILFLVMYVVVPGDPARAIAGKKADKSTIKAIHNKLGLDKPLYQQYFTYTANLAKGDLGTSYRYRRPVQEMLAEAMPATFVLALAAIIIEVILGVLAGIYAYVTKIKFIDAAITAGSAFLISVPVFWLGMILQYTFGIRLNLLPVSGNNYFTSLILPAITLSAISVAVVIRILKTSLKENQNADYLLVARAKGLSESQVLYKHQLKNALIPTITYIGMDFGALMTGAVATEIVFNWPGVGLLIRDAILERDIPVIISSILVLVVIYILFNFLVDIAYGYLNPKVRAGEKVA
ncbi:MAG: ABC transporter permease [Actinobacteria bacterium]|nr:MAG: ABC transporter permease [Actinomycetota bacterium]